VVLHVPGDPERPFGEREARGKFEGAVAPLVGPVRADRLWRTSLAVLGEKIASTSLLGEIEASLSPAAASS